MPSNGLDEEDKPCRACTDFRTWARQQTKGDGAAKKQSEAGSSQTGDRRPDCPLDRAELGRATWGLLHTMAEYFPERPSAQQSVDMSHFLNAFSQFYPCEPCALDLREDMKEHPPRVSSRGELARWLCERHNTVNLKLGKPVFDCGSLAQRWRDGWLDGSCD